MLMWIIILALLFIGLLLIIVELVFIPGTTVVGVLGLVFTIAGIIISYRHFGNEIGNYILIGTSVATLVSLFYSFRSGAWSRLALKSSIKSKVNEGHLDALQVGDIGVALSALRPFGKAEFGGRQFEVRTSGNYTESGTNIRITQILTNQIIVEPLNK